jgi:hypothetical protein
MQQHKIPSTSSAISPQQERTEPSGHRPCRHGVKSSLRRERKSKYELPCLQIRNVTMPSRRQKRGNQTEKLRMTLTAENTPLNHVIEETIDLR